MRALVTGSEGFLGRHFVKALDCRGHDVYGIDITDAHQRDALDFFRTTGRRFDLAVHCAAVVGGREMIDRNPLAQVMNYALDAAFIHWCAATRPTAAVYLSSSAAYPVSLQTGPGHRLREGDASGEPDAGYGWNKLTGEKLVAQAWDAGVNLTVVRPFSGYGTDQSLDYPFPSFVARALRRDDPFKIWGTGEQVRDWVHVDDVIGATLAFVDHGVRGPVNIGTGIGTSMIQLARRICFQVGYEPSFDVDPAAPTGVMYRVADTSLMGRYYTPQVTLGEGIARALRHVVNA